MPSIKDLKKVFTRGDDDIHPSPVAALSPRKTSDVSAHERSYRPHYQYPQPEEEDYPDELPHQSSSYDTWNARLDAAIVSARSSDSGPGAAPLSPRSSSSGLSPARLTLSPQQHHSRGGLNNTPQRGSRDGSDDNTEADWGEEPPPSTGQRSRDGTSNASAMTPMDHYQLQISSWDTEGGFPVMEIERIKTKTRKLRTSRSNGSLSENGENAVFEAETNAFVGTPSTSQESRNAQEDVLVFSKPSAERSSPSADAVPSDETEEVGDPELLPVNTSNSNESGELASTGEVPAVSSTGTTTEDGTSSGGRSSIGLLNPYTCAQAAQSNRAQKQMETRIWRNDVAALAQPYNLAHTNSASTTDTRIRIMQRAFGATEEYSLDDSLEQVMDATTVNSESVHATVHSQRSSRRGARPRQPPSTAAGSLSTGSPQYYPYQMEPSRAAKRAQNGMLQDFYRRVGRGLSRSMSSGDEHPPVEPQRGGDPRFSPEDPELAQYQQQDGDGEYLDSLPPIPTNTTGSTAASTTTMLHDLCSEATTPDDIAWRNAMYCLSQQPAYASVVDDQGWTPLHICCLNGNAPIFLIRALLYCFNSAAKIADTGGRLPLHFTAASATADPSLLQLLVDEYPPSISHADLKGFTPLHLLLKNVTVEFTTERARILLGLTIGMEEPSALSAANSFDDVSSLPEPFQRYYKQQQLDPHVVQRRGDHLQLGLDSLHRWLHRPKPITMFHHARDAHHEAKFASHPQDVQDAFRTLILWKRRTEQLEKQQQQQQRTSPTSKEAKEDDAATAAAAAAEAVEIALSHHLIASSSSYDYNGNPSSLNPAAMPTPTSSQLPVHMLVRRAFVERAQLEDSGGDPFVFGGGKKEREGGSSLSDGSPSDDEEEDDDNSNDSSIPTRPEETHLQHRRRHRRPRPSVPDPFSVLRLVIACYPRGLIVRDAHGYTPLWLALLGGHHEVNSISDGSTILSSSQDLLLPSLDIIELLLGKRTANAPLYGGRSGPGESLPDWAADLPLHPSSWEEDGRPATGKQQLAPPPRYLNPAMMLAPNHTRQLPLHIAAEEFTAHAPIIESIRNAYPAAVHVQDLYGRTPLHMALATYRRVPPTTRVLSLLYTDQVACIRTDAGKLPLDLLLEHAKTRHAVPPKEESALWHDSNDGERHADIYQRLLFVSLSGPAKPTSRRQARLLLQQLRRLPPWLRHIACGHDTVQATLTRDQASPWKFAAMILEGLLIVALIAVFRLQINEYAEAANSQGGRTLATWYTFCVYATATCRLLVQAGYWIIALYLSHFQYLVLWNIWRWMDVLGMLSVVITSALLYTDKVDDPGFTETLAVMTTVTTGLCWLSLLGYLSTWWHGAAVFLGGLQDLIWGYLLWPIVLFCGLGICFAQLFFSLLSCNGNSVPSVCSVRDAYRVVYLLLRGQETIWMDDEAIAAADAAADEQFLIMTPNAMVLIAFFLFALFLFGLGLVVLVLLAVATRQMTYEDVALSYFWEPKLARYCLPSDFGLQSSAALSWIVRGMKQLQGRLERGWSMVVVSLLGGTARRHKHWYAGGHQNDQQLPWIGALRVLIIVLLVLPLWFVSGLLAFGMLWPPQVRHWIVRPTSSATTGRNRGDGSGATQQEVTQLRQELSHMKQMSYERSSQVQYELKSLKAVIEEAMKEA